MKINIFQKLLFFSILIISGNLFVGYTLYESNQKRLDTELLVKHTELIISLSSNILSSIKDIETASRGYIITKDSAFLEPMNSAKNTIIKNIEQLKLFTQDNHLQQQRVDSIILYVQKRLKFSLETVKLRNVQGLESAIALVLTEKGKQYSDRLRILINEIQNDEKILLKQTKLENEQSEVTFNLYAIVIFVIIFVFTIMLLIALGNYLIQNKEKEKRASALVLANKELVFQNEEKEKRALELIIANKELVFQNEEKEKRASELSIAYKKVNFQKEEKEKKTAQLILANKELVFQNEEKEKRASELIIANKELVFQDEEKEKRASELIIANKELVFQNEEKEKRASELIIANKELVFQDEEKEKRASELIIANKELVFQNEEKEKRASELIIANKELVFQDKEKEKRASELIIANKELVFQDEEKEKRASELSNAYKKVDFQKEEKEKKVAELNIANEEIIFQNKENEKQEAANKELEAFSYSVSHDLRAPLRHIGGFVELLIKNKSSQLDEVGLRYLNIISESSHEMGNLIDALLTFSRLSRAELQKTNIVTKEIVNRVIKIFSEDCLNRKIEFKIADLPNTLGDANLITQVWTNLISNAIKYTKNKENSIIDIGGYMENANVIFFIKDNGAGFDMKYADKLFGVFQRLHKAKDFEGIGIGLANVNRIVTRHFGKCWAESEIDKGASFFFSLPQN